MNLTKLLLPLALLACGCSREEARAAAHDTAEKAKAKYASQFPKLTLVSIEQGFGGWTQADKDHFVDGASFDQIYTYPFFRSFAAPGQQAK